MPKDDYLKQFFPGMLPRETQLWREWLIDHEMEFERFEYNVHVGPGVDTVPAGLDHNPELREKMRKQFYQATQHRIDVVGHVGPSVTLIEVKVRGTVTALGQLLAYRDLWSKQTPPTAPLFLRLVVRRLTPGMAEVMAGHRIRVDVVGT